MDNEVFRDLTHREAAVWVAQAATRAGHQAWHEFPLPNGKIADVLIVTNRGNLEIVEVKTSWLDSLVSDAFEKYWHCCHRLYIAVPGLEAIPLAGLLWPPRWTTNSDRIGVIGVHRTGLRFLRPAVDHPVNNVTQSTILRQLAQSSRLVS